jgi:hypothetical protein
MAYVKDGSRDVTLIKIDEFFLVACERYPIVLILTRHVRRFGI